jgi:hypothetical protein
LEYQGQGRDILSLEDVEVVYSISMDCMLPWGQTSIVRIWNTAIKVRRFAYDVSDDVV